MTADDHGMLATYVNYKCRCVRCRRANTVYLQSLRRRKAELLAANPALAEHGKASTYNEWRCRCRPCKDAQNENQRSRRARKRAAEQAHVEAAGAVS